jgi:hypothetical protein
VTIPHDEVERLGLKEGWPLGLYVLRLDVQPDMRPAVRDAFERSWQRGEDAYRYLAEEEDRMRERG